MSRRRRSPIEDLRLTIDCLPRRTREAMLEGVRANPVIVGGYTDDGGGICPMLAAHRHGGCTDFVKGQVPPESMIQTSDIVAAVRMLLALTPGCVIPEILFQLPGQGRGGASA